MPIKIKAFSLILIIVSLMSLFFFIGKVYADDVAPVPKARLPCDQIDNPEFNSLRPYQAAPCGDYHSAFFCGNQINIVETKTKTERGIHDFLPVEWCNGHCSGGTDVDGKTYWIDLSEVQLPILGNTELVQNSQNATDQIDDATKMNEYVSWYLNGVNNRAEYGDSKNTDYETVNLSGPIQKLLPQAIADAQRIASIASASATGANTPDDDQTDIPQSGPLTHNQVVVCTNILGKPIDCYNGNNTGPNGTPKRLLDWQGNISISRSFSNIIKSALSLIPGIGQAIESVASEAWNKREPPLPWGTNPNTGKPFTPLEYQKAYNEWRGQSCITIPIVGKLLCVDNPLVTNQWADLFPYIPMASTPDKLGKMPIFTTLIQPSGANLVNSSWKKEAAPSLYYAHTQEVKDLSVSLNSTYSPKGLGSSEIPESTEVNDYNSEPRCRVLDVRTNQGDNLFPIRTPGDVGVNVKFYVNRLDNCHVDYRTNNQGIEIPYTTCTGQVNIGIQTNPNKIPNVNDIWNTTVGGNASTFRRIYPKVEAGAPVSCVADMPAVSKAVYKPIQGTDSIGVEGPLFSQDSEKMDPENAKIYFSHLGSVYDYFLKGIQTALRPQGYGEPSPISGSYCQKTSGNFGDICAVADAYHIPCCQLKGVAEVETGGGTNVGSGSCSTKNGTFSCCNGNVCGPSQIACGQYDGFAGNDNIDMCDPVGSAELLARAMLLKLCQAAGRCDTYDWEKEKSKAMQFSVPDGDYTATGYFYGLANGCTVSACTQYRWGPGNTYCDSVKSYCDTGQILPDNPHPEFCAACNQELERAGQTPINCSSQ